MKKIVKNSKEEELFLREVDDQELKELENGGLCFFWVRCVAFMFYQPINCKSYVVRV